MSTNNVHVMIDIESWSTAKNAMIISIGAVKFNPTEAIVTERFHVGIDPALSPNLTGKFHVDPGTVMWWMHPDRDAPRKRWLEMEKLDLASALYGFSEWFGPDKDVPVWGNGSTFDCVVFRNTFEALFMECPWGYRSEKCYRTVKNLAPEVPLMRPRAYQTVDEGMAHDALYDATVQALHLQEILRHIEVRP